MCLDNACNSYLVGNILLHRMVTQTKQTGTCPLWDRYQLHEAHSHNTTVDREI